MPRRCGCWSEPGEGVDLNQLKANFSLEGRVAMVTGASHGIGQGLAMALAHAGAELLLTARSEKGLAETGSLLDRLGARYETCALELRDLSSIRPAVSKALHIWRCIDILVNNAGTNIPQEALDFDGEQWDTILDTNLKGTFFLCQEVARQAMIPQRRGKIINIGSQMGVVTQPKRAPYCASKGGLVLLSKALAVEWAPYGILVNVLAPILVETPLSRPVMEDKEFMAQLLRKVPLGRVAGLADLVGGLIFLASDASNFVTGHVLLIDGGWTAM